MTKKTTTKLELMRFFLLVYVVVVVTFLATAAEGFATIRRTTTNPCNNYNNNNPHRSSFYYSQGLHQQERISFEKGGSAVSLLLLSSAQNSNNDEDDDIRRRPPAPLYPRKKKEQQVQQKVRSFVAGCLLAAAVTMGTSTGLLFSPTVQGSSTTAAAHAAVPLEQVSPTAGKKGGGGGMYSKRYWSIMEHGAAEEKQAANTALLDHAVGTINTMFYDPSGGAKFDTHDFYNLWKKQWLPHHEELLQSRDGAVLGLGWLMEQLHDPYSVYLTRDQLKQELQASSDGFLGLGAVVEAPSQPLAASSTSPSTFTPPLALKLPLSTTTTTSSTTTTNNNKSLLPTSAVTSLPVVTAVAPDSPAERSGLTVGDRIVAIGTDCFLGKSPSYLKKRLESKYHAENYLGFPEVTIAKPVYNTIYNNNNDNDPAEDGAERSFRRSSAGTADRDIIVAYRSTRVRLPTKNSDETLLPFQQQQLQRSGGGESDDILTTVAGGDSIVHYQLLLPKNSIFVDPIAREISTTPSTTKVGYIRLTRFSRASTSGFVKAIQALETAGADSYIIDLRNCYGGVIQEAMLTASSLLRDPHAVLCYTMNSRGGFTPHDVEEYVVDTRYPGYLLSSEGKNVVLAQVQLEDPEFFDEDGIMWVPPSSYASLHEQTMKRGIHKASFSSSSSPSSQQQNLFASSFSSSLFRRAGNTAANGDAIRFANNNLNNFKYNMEKEQLFSSFKKQMVAQKNIVLLINEGTASSAEVFASALHDNGRTVALVGTRTFSKGLIQHTFPMPDGGGLRLTVAEYLTPALQHVSKVGMASFDPNTGERVGGGIQPDIQCQSKQGIPANVGADYCVGVALDALDEAVEEVSLGGGPQLMGSKGGNTGATGSSTGLIGQAAQTGPMVKRVGGALDGSHIRRPVTAGIVKDDF